MQLGDPRVCSRDAPQMNAASPGPLRFVDVRQMPNCLSFLSRGGFVCFKVISAQSPKRLSFIEGVSGGAFFCAPTGD